MDFAFFCCVDLTRVAGADFFALVFDVLAFLGCGFVVGTVEIASSFFGCVAIRVDERVPRLFVALSSADDASASRRLLGAMSAMFAFAYSAVVMWKTRARAH